MTHKIEYQLKDGFTEMDFDKVTRMLETAFWCTGIKKDEIIRGAQFSALVVGAFTRDHDQIDTRG